MPLFFEDPLSNDHFEAASIGFPHRKIPLPGQAGGFGSVITYSGIKHAWQAAVLFCGRILVAQQAVRRLVLFDLRETAHGRIEPVIGVVVVALADLAEQHGARS